MDILIPLVIIAVVFGFSVRKFKPELWKKIKDWFMDGYERVRARNSKGQYIKDDPKTKKNEAYTLRKKKPTKK